MANYDITAHLTLGGWFYVAATPGANGAGLIGKYATANISYLLRTGNSATTIVASVSSDGAAETQVTTPAAAGTGAWFFAAMRFTPSTELKVWLNGTPAINTTSIPASIYSGSAPFEIGRYNAGNYLNGRASMCFLCAAALPDAAIDTIYQQSRALFGG